MEATTNKISKKQALVNERNEAIESLKKLVPVGKTVYTVCTHVSSSGMSRKIKCYISHENRIVNITWYVSQILGYKMKDGCLIVGGCGMDMGFHVVYSLGRSLNPEGFKLVEGQYGRNGDKSGYDTDGGYSLNQQWL